MFSREQIKIASDAEVKMFLEKGTRHESTDPETGYGLITYWFNGECLVFDQFVPRRFERRRKDRYDKPT